MGRHGAPRSGGRLRSAAILVVPALTLVLAAGGGYAWWSNRAAASTAPPASPAAAGCAEPLEVLVSSELGPVVRDLLTATDAQGCRLARVGLGLGAGRHPADRRWPGARGVGAGLLDVGRRPPGDRRPADLAGRLGRVRVGRLEPRAPRLPHVRAERRHRGPRVVVGPAQRQGHGPDGQPRRRHREPARLLLLAHRPPRGARPHERRQADLRLALRRRLDPGPVLGRRGRPEGGPALPRTRAGGGRVRLVVGGQGQGVRADGGDDEPGLPLGGRQGPGTRAHGAGREGVRGPHLRRRPGRGDRRGVPDRGRRDRAVGRGRHHPRVHRAGDT